MDNAPAVDFKRIAKELHLRPDQVAGVSALLDEGNTVPFITRYRKERTGNLDEEAIRQIQSRVESLRQLNDRAQTILRLIESQGQLTDQLRADIQAADSLKRLEDLYLPFRPKRRSRATVAKERGLEPFANLIWSGISSVTDLEQAAAEYVDPEKELNSPDEVLAGASDILAERISEDAHAREIARHAAHQTGRLVVTAAKGAEEKGGDFRDYFDHDEAVAKIPPHRVLAINRGEAAKVLRVKFACDTKRAETNLERYYRLDEHRHAEFLRSSVSDALSRLILPSLEREIRGELTDKAELHAIGVFAENLKNLLLGPPLRDRRVVAIDPGFRTGSKLAALDEFGRLIAFDVIHLTGSAEKTAAEKEKLKAFLETNGAKLVAIGNGTACRETEEFVSELIAESCPGVEYIIVNEAGASVYSASTIAREEFPDLDATVRGTVSIGRRLQDPLSELVKIDPQHIGVGMYQHDIAPKRLEESLNRVIESCVNYVGVDLNVASPSLLEHVSGLNQLMARRVVEWRKENGPFKNRRDLLKVNGIGPRAFTQAAGFLKVQAGEEPLDITWIHPESYEPARKILSRLSLTPESLKSAGGDGTALRDKLQDLEVKALAEELEIGVPTCGDILAALARPGLDPRSDLPGAIFRQGILKLEDLEPGMELKGTVLNVVDFGAFVDVGLKDSGLVHISQLANRFVKSPHEIVSVGDVVTVWVLDADLERRRVSLTMLGPGGAQKGPL